MSMSLNATVTPWRAKMADRQAVADPNCGEISAAEGERLRQAIDSGRTYEKVAGSDPAVVPFETDAEAAGAPTSRQAVRSTLAKETKEPPRARRNVIDADQNHNPFAFLYLSLVIASIAGVLVALWFIP
jgi:hypothetical protein